MVPVEPVSLTISVVALASLFETCVKCFDYIELGRNYAHDCTILLAKLDVEKVRFSIWGRSVGLATPCPDNRLELPEIGPTVQKLLNCISLLFTDAERLKKRYGLRYITDNAEERAIIPSTSSGGISTLKLSYQRFLTRISQNQRISSTATKAHWAIRDKQKFTNMLADLKDLIDGLRDITKSFSDLERQQVMLKDEISSLSDIGSLQLLQEALAENYDGLSDVASQRIIAIENGSVMDTTSSFRQLTLSSYATAPEIQISDTSNLPPGTSNKSSESTILRKLSYDKGLMQQSGAPELAPGAGQHKAALKVILEDDLEPLADLPKEIPHPATLRRIARQLADIASSQPLWFNATLIGDNMSELLGSFVGPPDTPYDEGVFWVYMQIPRDHPFKPPKCNFLTKVYHPNIDSQGKICLDILEDRWSPAHTISSVLISICSILDDPCVEDALVSEIAEQYVKDRATYETNARLYTRKYAMRDQPGPDQITRARNVILGQRRVEFEARERYSKHTKLHYAASYGHEATVRSLLEKGVYVDSRDKDQMTALLWAVKHRNETIVRLLLQRGSDINARDRYGNTTLHEAARNMHEAMVRLLLEKGPEVDARDGYGETALHEAVENRHEVVVQLLLEKGADVDVKNIHEQTPLHKAARNSNNIEVWWLLNKGLDFEMEESWTRKDGRTLMHRAAEREHEAVVRLLLEKGADIEVRDSNGTTALHEAARGGYEVVVRLLLEKGANVESKDKRGRTALYLAAKEEYEAVMRLLLEKGADIEAKDDDGTTALHTVAMGGCEAAVRLLLEMGANVESKDKCGRTVLYRAAEKDYEAVVRLLLDKGADGTTALYRAAIRGRKEMVWLLLEMGANPKNLEVEKMEKYNRNIKDEDFEAATLVIRVWLSAFS